MSSSNALDEALSPLLACLPAVGGLHLSLQGSAHRPGHEAGDVDVYVVVRRMTRNRFARLENAAMDCCQQLDRQTQARWRLETRRGPLKPTPGEGRLRQLHLLLEDGASLGRQEPALVLHYHAGGRVLAGESLLSLRDLPREREPLLQSCRREIERMRDALAREERSIRSWSFDPAPALVEGRLPLTCAWDRYCLLRTCAAVADRLCLNACLEFPSMLLELTRTPTLFEEVVRPLGPGSLVGPVWDLARERTLSFLTQRMQQLRSPA